MILFLNLIIPLLHYVALPLESINLNNMVTANQSSIFNWLSPKDAQVPVMNYMKFNGLLSQSYLHQVGNCDIPEIVSYKNKE